MNATLVVDLTFLSVGMDGMQFVNAIKEKPNLELVPVIILTARAGDEARIEGLVCIFLREL